MIRGGVNQEGKMVSGPGWVVGAWTNGDGAKAAFKEVMREIRWELWGCVRKSGWNRCFRQANSEMGLSRGETYQPGGGVFALLPR